MGFGDRHLDDALDRWLTTPPEEGWIDSTENMRVALAAFWAAYNRPEATPIEIIDLAYELAESVQSWLGDEEAE